MNTRALDFCMQVSLGHASLQLKLDDALGTWHGMGLDDFRLLRQLAQAPDGRLPLAELVRPLGLRPSAVMRQLVPMEKTGRIQREPGRQVLLRPAGRAQLAEATETAAAICEAALPALGSPSLSAAQDLLARLCRSPALEL